MGRKKGMSILCLNLLPQNLACCGSIQLASHSRLTPPTLISPRQGVMHWFVYSHREVWHTPAGASICCFGVSCKQGCQTHVHLGPLSLKVAFKGLNVILGLYKCNYSLTLKPELSCWVQTGCRRDKTRRKAGFGLQALCLPPVL